MKDTKNAPGTGGNRDERRFRNPTLDHGEKDTLMKWRKEKDFLGEMDVPVDAYFGIQTWRAVGNFSISGLRAPRVFLRALAEIKKAAARFHEEIGALDAPIANAICQAASEVIEGLHDDQFVVDVFQAGAGTSQHMNINEVLANRAAELLGFPRGIYDKVHPNDHVNMGQSTNDVFPTAMRISVLLQAPELIDSMRRLGEALAEKSASFHDIVKSGRTHLQDAVPVSLGQEFSGYAASVKNAADHIEEQIQPLRHLGIGGSAVGTGLNTGPGYRTRMTELLQEQTGLSLNSSENLFEAMQSMSPFLRLSGAMRNAAVELSRIANDLRLLSSGPTTGLAEILLPGVQPGSSIMPGKVNPVIAECLNMICFQILGNDTCVTHAAGAGQFELNVMMPIISYNILWSMQILTHGATMFREHCVQGIQARESRCAQYLDSTIGLATVLNPVIGYHNAAKVAKEATQTGKTIKDIVLSKGILSEETFQDLVKKSLGEV